MYGYVQGGICWIAAQSDADLRYVIPPNHGSAKLPWCSVNLGEKVSPGSGVTGLKILNM